MHNHLLQQSFERARQALRAGESGIWGQLERALALAADDDPEIGESDAALAVACEDVDELERLVRGWQDGSTPLPVSDRAILKRAMKALRKRLKLARLDDESSLSGGQAMSGGRESAISAVRPPDQYPDEVWKELVRQGKLRDVGRGLLEPTGE